MATEIHTEKADIQHDEQLDKTIHMISGADQALAEGRSPWKVLWENKKALLIIMAVQSNAIIVG